MLKKFPESIRHPNDSIVPLTINAITNLNTIFVCAKLKYQQRKTKKLLAKVCTPSIIQTRQNGTLLCMHQHLHNWLALPVSAGDSNNSDVDARGALQLVTKLFTIYAKATEPCNVNLNSHSFWGWGNGENERVLHTQSAVSNGVGAKTICGALWEARGIFKAAE